MNTAAFQMEKETVTEASPGYLETPTNHDIGMLNVIPNIICIHSVTCTKQCHPLWHSWGNHGKETIHVLLASVYMSQTTHTTPDVLISVMVRVVVRVKAATLTMLQCLWKQSNCLIIVSKCHARSHN